MRIAVTTAIAALLCAATQANAAAPVTRKTAQSLPPGSLLQDTLRREKQPVRMAMAQPVLGPLAFGGGARATAPAAPAAPVAPPVVQRARGVALVEVFSPGAKVRVSLDLREVSVREALKQVFGQTKLAYTVDADVPEGVRVTAKATNVQLHTALDLITDAAGVGWTVEQKLSGPVSIPGNLPREEQLQRISAATSPTYRIGRTVQRAAGYPRVFTKFNGVEGGGGFIAEPAIPYEVWGREERSTFTCPHCKAQNTVVRVKNQPKCPKCERLFQPTWQYCPGDGTKRPAAPAEWRFCPGCGKQVQPDKTQEHEESFLESTSSPLVDPAGVLAPVPAAPQRGTAPSGVETAPADPSL